MSSRRLPHQFVRSSHQYLYDMLGWYRTERRDARGGHRRRQSEGPVHQRALRHRRRARPRRRVLQGGQRRLRRRPAPAAAARPALGRQVLRRDPDEARARGVQPHGRRRAVRVAGLAAARVAAEPGSRPACAASSARPTASRSRASCRPTAARASTTSSRATSCSSRWSGCSCPRPHASASAPTRRTIPTTADIADLVGSVDLSKVAEIGDEGDPRAWSWSGAVYAASRGMLEMIEILKVKREFLYLLLTLTQEKNVKVSRFPLIHLDETIVAHTNLAEFNKFLQEKENEALLDRMVIVKVPVHAVVPRRGAHLPQARLQRAGVPHRALRSARAGARRGVLDPHAADRSRRRRASTSRRSCGSTPARTSRASRRATCERMRAEQPDEGMSGVSPRFVINAISQRDHAQRPQEPHQHGDAAGAQGLHPERCAHGRQPEEELGGFPRARAQGFLQPLGQGGRASRAVRFLRGRGAAAAREVSRRGGGLARQARGQGSRSRARRARPTSASCARSRRRSRSPSPASSRSARKSCARRWSPSRPARSSRSTATRACTRPSSSTCSRSGATCCGS